MTRKTNWNFCVKQLLKSELIKRGITYSHLASMLNEMGIEETKSGIDSKMSRGTFSAAFLLQCLNAIGCQQLISTVDNTIFPKAKRDIKIKKATKNQRYARNKSIKQNP
jgi:hypothetical protein